MRKVLKDKDREMNLQNADPLLYTDLGLETVLFLLEQGRKEKEEEDNVESLLRRCRTALQANLLYLEAKQSAYQSAGDPSAVVRYTDFQLSKDLTAALCRPTSLYGHLAKIRFTHRFDNKAAEIRIAEAEGHPPVGAIAAVPIFKKDRPVGCLAVITDKPRTFTDGYILLLSVVAEIVSIVESGAGG